MQVRARCHPVVGEGLLELLETWGKALQPEAPHHLGLVIQRCGASGLPCLVGPGVFGLRTARRRTGHPVSHTKVSSGSCQTPFSAFALKSPCSEQVSHGFLGASGSPISPICPLSCLASPDARPWSGSHQAWKSPCLLFLDSSAQGLSMASEPSSVPTGACTPQG